MSCVNCETLKYNIQNLENMIATLEQENRQQHARNQRLASELAHAERIIEDFREADSIRPTPMSYNQIKESFSR